MMDDDNDLLLQLERELNELSDDDHDNDNNTSTINKTNDNYDDDNEYNELMSTLESTSLLTYQNALKHLGIKSSSNTTNDNNNSSDTSNTNSINDNIISFIHDNTTLSDNTIIVHEDDVIAVMSQMLESVEYIMSISYNTTRKDNVSASTSYVSSKDIEIINTVNDDINDNINDTNTITIDDDDVTEESPWQVEKLIDDKRKKNAMNMIEEQTKILQEEEDLRLKELERDRVERLERKKKFIEEMNRININKSMIKMQKMFRGCLARIRFGPLLAMRKKEEEEKREIEETRLKALAEEEARLKAAEEARLRAEEEARLKAIEEEARLKAEEEARLKALAEEEARLKAEEEARLKAEEEARLKAEEEARLKAEEEARVIALAEDEARQKAIMEEEASKKRLADEARRKVTEQEKAKSKSQGKNQITPITRPSWGGSVAPQKKIVQRTNIDDEKPVNEVCTIPIPTESPESVGLGSQTKASLVHCPPRVIAESVDQHNNVEHLNNYWQNLVSSNLVTTDVNYLGTSCKSNIKALSCLQTGKSNKSKSRMTPLMRGLVTWIQCSNNAKGCSDNYDPDTENDCNNIINDNFNESHDDEFLERLGLRSDPSQVKKLKLNVEGLSSSLFLRRFDQLRSLELNVNKIRNLNGLVGLRYLTYLSINDNSLSNIDPLGRIKSLQDLRLDSNNLVSLKPLERLHQLRRLSAKVNNLIDFPNLSCQCLQKLELYQNKLTTLDDNCLLELPKLMHLDVGSNKLERVSGKALSRCQLLQTLVLSQNKLTEVPSNLFLPQLKTLWLSGNKLKNLNPWTNANFISESSWPVFLPMLQKLYLNDNNIITIANGCLDTSPLLSVLDLSFNEIQTVEDLNAVKSCLILKTLELSDNPIINNDSNNTAILNQFIRQLSKQNRIDESSIEAKINSFIKLEAYRSASLSDSKASLDSKRFIQFLNTMTIEQNNFFLKEKLEREDDDESWSDNIISCLSKQLQLLTEWTEPSIMSKYACVIKYTKDANDEDIKSQLLNNLTYVIKIQATFRGYIRRKQLKKVMLSSRYIDNDIEEMLMNDDFMDDMNLDESPELQNNWFSNRDSKWLDEKDYQNTVINDDDVDDDEGIVNEEDDTKDDGITKDDSNENVSSNFDNYFNSNSNAMAYGDHIRRRQNNNSGGALRTLSADHPTIQVEDFKENLSRPSTGMTSVSTVSTTSKAYSEQEDEFLSRFKEQKKAENIDDVAKEWGVSNPKVAAMIMKRNKRMKGFQKAAQTREKDSASERYNRFVRTNVRLANSSTAK